MVKKHKFVIFFIKNIRLRNITKANGIDSNADKLQMEAWMALINIYVDLNGFLKDINEVFSNNICKKIKKLNVEIKPFQDCLQIFSEELKGHQKNICKTIIDLLTEKIVTVIFLFKILMIFYFRFLAL